VETPARRALESPALARNEGLDFPVRIVMGHPSAAAETSGRIRFMKIIKREILIDAPVAKVWEHITDSNKIAGWLMPNDFEPKLGKEFALDCNEQGKISCVVKEIVPFQKLVYGFKSKVTKVETLVTITLTKEGRGTRLTLVHSGWDALPPGEQGIADLFGDGWGGSLAKLQKQIPAAGTPP
jgi:uncharacterized protein YndB with AHSA1/START domain